LWSEDDEVLGFIVKLIDDELLFKDVGLLRTLAELIDDEILLGDVLVRFLSNNASQLLEFESFDKSFIPN